MESIIRSHVSNVMAHYKGQCYAWDVVNEALEDDGKWRQSPSMLDGPNPLIEEEKKLNIR
jgi:GH35 family endo-1,4-beta-xylanase